MEQVQKFDPEAHYYDLYQAFTEYAEAFAYTYDALNRTAPQGVENQDEWTDMDKRRIFLGKHASRAFQRDFEELFPNEQRSKVKFTELVSKFQEKYTSTRNYTLSHYNFHNSHQLEAENFETFVNRVKVQANNCNFSCGAACTVSNTLIRDQIVFGTNNSEIREQAMKAQWGLKDIIKNGRLLEEASRNARLLEAEREPPENPLISRIAPGKYSRASNQRRRLSQHCRTCSDKRCKGGRSCVASQKMCFLCGKKGHFKGASACEGYRSKRERTRRTEDTYYTDSDESDGGSMISQSTGRSSHTSYDGRSNSRHRRHRSQQRPRSTEDYSKVGRIHIRSTEGSRNSKYSVSISIKGSHVSAFADTGADINVMSLKTAKRLNLPMSKSSMKIYPYGSNPIKVLGYFKGKVSHGPNSAEAKLYIIEPNVETLLSGKLSERLKIITFSNWEKVKVHKVTTENDFGRKIAKEYPDVFKGIGTLVNHRVHFHVDQNIPPVAQASRPIPYHLREKFDVAIKEMVENDIIEEHSGPAPWVSNPVLAPKDNGAIRVTLDMRRPNEAIKATNLPIPRVEDIKTSLSGSTCFSKLDLKAAFHQLKLDRQSRKLTVFHANGRLMRYKRLVMGAKPASGELNKALSPLFSRTKFCHVIHDDIIIAAPTKSEHDNTVREALNILQDNGLTLNSEKCLFRQNEIPFWGLRISKDGIKPDPVKVQCLRDATPPESKDEVMSFLCFVQALADFIPRLSQKTNKLRELTKKNKPFKWSNECQKEFEKLTQAIDEDGMMSHFEPKAPTYIFVDAHRSGLSAILAQCKWGDLKAVAFASRSTRPEEQRYPQLDLEAMAVDFGLRRFRQYITGGPQVTVFTDHKPLVSIFKHSRKGSIRTDRIKLRHQDLNFQVSWIKGGNNPADYLSRHASPLSAIPEEWSSESTDLHKTVWALQRGPVVESITTDKIVKETRNDAILSRLKQGILKGSISKSDIALSPYRKILDKLTIIDEVIFKENQIILPKNLHELVIKEAHRRSHQGIDHLKRRIRSHFWFPGINGIAEKVVKSCSSCQMFTNKTTVEPLKIIPKTKTPWEEVSVDIFGPMPDRRYVIAVQDTKSRFPAAKIIRSTSAAHVIRALESIYSDFGKPDKHRTDNGPPFNSQEFKKFSDENFIRHHAILPYHPQANPVETLMKPMGKALKIAIWEKQDKEAALERFLEGFRGTPHVSLTQCPGDLMFRGGYKHGPTRKILNQSDIRNAYKSDINNKLNRKEAANQSKHKYRTKWSPGQAVLVRNHLHKKFEPTFGPDVHKIVKATGAVLVLQRVKDGKTIRRHANDVKAYIEATRHLPTRGSVSYQDPQPDIPQYSYVDVHSQPEYGSNSLLFYADPVVNTKTASLPSPMLSTVVEEQQAVSPPHSNIPMDLNPTTNERTNPRITANTAGEVTAFPTHAYPVSPTPLPRAFSPTQETGMRQRSSTTETSEISPGHSRTPARSPTEQRSQTIGSRPQTPRFHRKSKTGFSLPRALKNLKDYNKPGYNDMEQPIGQRRKRREY